MEDVLLSMAAVWRFDRIPSLVCAPWLPAGASNANVAAVLLVSPVGPAVMTARRVEQEKQEVNCSAGQVGPFPGTALTWQGCSELSVTR